MSIIFTKLKCKKSKKYDNLDMAICANPFPSKIYNLHARGMKIRGKSHGLAWYRTAGATDPNFEETPRSVILVFHHQLLIN